jgi:hypothetical protein
MHNHNNTNTFKFHGLSLVPMNNLLINEANPESNESVVGQHSGISKAKLVYCCKANVANIYNPFF